MKSKIERFNIEQIIETIQRIAAGDFTARIPFSSKQEPYDAIATGINMLGEEIEIHSKEREEHEEALLNMLEDVNEARLVTERAKDALIESEEKFRLIAETSSDMIFQIDREGNFTYCSPAIKKILKISPDDLIGTNYKNYFTASELPIITQAFQQAIMGEQLDPKELLLVSEEEIFTPMEISLVPVIKNDKIIGVQGIARDITERKRTEKQLQKYHKHLEELVEERTKQLQETNDELEAFAFSVSHDLRAPLRAMEGFAQVLLEDYSTKLEAGGVEYAERIIEAANRMNNLIDDLLSYSRLSRAEFKLKNISLGKVVKEIISQLEPRIKEKEVEVDIETKLPIVKGHRTTLIKIISNLIINAMTFVDSGVKPKIRIWSENHNGWVRLYIEDNGIGIAPEYHEKIFRIFERLHGIETYPGTGIGLAIVRKGIERMDGKVGLESAEGKGSRFWIDVKSTRVKKYD
ncbi:MAG: PAS domain S-box protein [Thermoplasmata archaeon]|nr:PAS domain S-box protein [Thermoplasmata archaeon]